MSRLTCITVCVGWIQRGLEGLKSQPGTLCEHLILMENLKKEMKGITGGKLESGTLLGFWILVALYEANFFTLIKNTSDNVYNIESLCCLPESNTVAYANYSSI